MTPFAGTQRARSTGADEYRPGPETVEQAAFYFTAREGAILVRADSRLRKYLPIHTALDDLPAVLLHRVRFAFWNRIKAGDGPLSHDSELATSGRWTTVSRKAPPPEDATAWRTPAPSIRRSPAANSYWPSGVDTRMSPRSGLMVTGPSA